MIELLNGITILYANDITKHLTRYRRNNKVMYRQKTDIGLNDVFIIGEEQFHELPQSKRIKWCENTCGRLLERKKKSVFVTNDYYLINIIQTIVSEDQFQIYNMDVKKTFDNFALMTPNPTLKVAQYVQRLKMNDEPTSWHLVIDDGHSFRRCESFDSENDAHQ